MTVRPPYECSPMVGEAEETGHKQVRRKDEALPQHVKAGRLLSESWGWATCDEQLRFRYMVEFRFVAVELLLQDDVLRFCCRRILPKFCYGHIEYVTKT